MYGYYNLILVNFTIGIFYQLVFAAFSIFSHFSLFFCAFSIENGAVFNIFNISKVENSLNSEHKLLCDVVIL